MNPPARHSLPTTLLQEWRLKLLCLALIGLIGPGTYFLAMHTVVFPVIQIQPGIIDRAIPFLDSSVYVYISMYPQLILGLMTMPSRPEVHRFTAGVCAMALAASLVFFLFPTTYARPAGVDPNWVYRILVSLDKPLNCCPSLHAAYAVFATLMIQRSHLSRTLAAIAWIWTLAILLSTLSTRQHAFLDIAAGSLLAIVAFLAVLNLPRPARPPR